MANMLAGKVALVTGAARGIGKCIALKLAEYGADVIVNDLKVDENSEVMKEIHSFGVKAFPLQGDITDCQAVSAMVAKAVKEMGFCNGTKSGIGINCGRFYFSVRNLKFKLIIKKSSLKVTLFGETIFVRFEKHSNS